MAFSNLAGIALGAAERSLAFWIGYTLYSYVVGHSAGPWQTGFPCYCCSHGGCFLLPQLPGSRSRVVQVPRSEHLADDVRRLLVGRRPDSCLEEGLQAPVLRVLVQG